MAFANRELSVIRRWRFAPLARPCRLSSVFGWLHTSQLIHPSTLSYLSSSILTFLFSSWNCSLAASLFSFDSMASDTTEYESFGPANPLANFFNLFSQRFALCRIIAWMETSILFRTRGSSVVPYLVIVCNATSNLLGKFAFHICNPHLVALFIIFGVEPYPPSFLNNLQCPPMILRVKSTYIHRCRIRISHLHDHTNQGELGITLASGLYSEGAKGTLDWFASRLSVIGLPTVLRNPCIAR